MRLAADSITSADIPVGHYPIVAGYVDGIYAWSEQDWQRHTAAGAIAVGVAVLPTTNAGEVCDVESGDLTPEQAVRWVQMRRDSGFAQPTVYCSISAWRYVAAQFINAGVAQPNWWLASYDDNPVIPAGAIGKQYANEPFTGGHFDLSVIADYWPGVDPVTPQKEDWMPLKELVIATGHDVDDYRDIPGVHSASDYTAYALCVRNARGAGELDLSAVFVGLDGSATWQHNFKLAESQEEDVWLPLGLVGSLVLQTPNKPYAFSLKACDPALHPTS